MPVVDFQRHDRQGRVVEPPASLARGAAAGEEASRIAVETVQQRMTNGTYKKPGDYGTMDSYALAEKLENLVREANNNILSRAKAKEYRQFGWLVTPLGPGRPLIVLRSVACVVGLAVVAYLVAVIGWSIYSVLRWGQ